MMSARRCKRGAFGVRAGERVLRFGSTNACGNLMHSPERGLRESASTAHRPAFNLRTVTTPILLHLIGRELRYPRLFLLRCRASLWRFKRSVDPRFPIELVEIAALPIWVYLNLSKRIGKSEGIRDHARRHSHRRRCAVEPRIRGRRRASDVREPLRARARRE